MAKANRINSPSHALGDPQYQTHCQFALEPSVIKLLEMATAAGWDAAQVSYAIMMLAATNLKSSNNVPDQP
ncbi:MULTISPECIES: hypothetical protein [unclassified Mesorhizobium]|uniref:hypothetical protein n=1 Tax=unclassified Mesorhizobium TaxID=325217 RepID=UPI003014C2AD